MSVAEGRKFGLTVGLAFLVITALVWWRGHVGVVPFLGGLGAALVLGGLVLPTRLGPVYRAWMGLAHLLSKVTTPIFMGIVYFVVLTPVGIVMRLVGRRFLVHAPQDRGYWMARGGGSNDMERQF